jgi:hypothetical protein
MNTAFELEKRRMLESIDELRAQFSEALKDFERLIPIHERQQLEARLKSRTVQPVNQITKLLR